MEYDHEYLQRIRELAGISQQELADKTGLSRSHIADIERGKHSPTVDTAERIAAALGVPLRGFYKLRETVI